MKCKPSKLLLLLIPSLMCLSLTGCFKFEFSRNPLPSSTSETISINSTNTSSNNSSYSSEYISSNTSMATTSSQASDNLSSEFSSENSSEIVSSLEDSTISSNIISSEQNNSSLSEFSSENLNENSTPNIISSNISSLLSSDISSENSSTTNSSQPQIPDEKKCMLTKSNAPSVLNDSYQSFEYKIDDLMLEYNNAKKDTYGHVNLTKYGFITNEETSPFGLLKGFTINYSVLETTNQNEKGFGYLKYRTSDNYIDNPNDVGKEITTIDNDYTVSFEDDSQPNYISFWTPREIVINSLTFIYRDADYYRNNEDFTIKLISTNDIHGQVKQDSGYPGLSSLTNKIKQEAQKDDQYNILIDQGDLYQGTAESGLTDGYIMDDFLIQNGYESTTLGNHEFDWGEERVEQHDKYLPLPILANNIRKRSDSSSPSYVSPYKLVSRNGIKIGIIGSIGNCYSSISSSKVKDIYFLTGSSLTEQIKKDSQSLKNLGADFIILSLHDGADSGESNGVSSLSYYDINSLSGSYVDLVLEGHSHQKYAFYDSKGVWHIQNGGNGSSFAITNLECTYSNTLGEYQVSVSISTTPQHIIGSTSISSGKDASMSEIDTWYNENIYGAKRSEVVGRNVPYMDDSVVEDKVAEMYYKKAISVINNSYTPVLGGGFLRTRTPYNLSSGTVTYGDVYALLPFENDIVLCSIQGKYLKSRFLNNTSDDYHIYSTITASSVVDSQTYYLITDNYSSDYSYNKLTVIKNLTLEYGIGYARDVFSEYLKTNYL